MKRNIALAAVAAFALSACSGLKDALNAHTDWVARAGTAELSVAKLATLLGKSRAPIRKDIAKSIANVWVDYQLLGVAAAHGDSLNDPKLIDEAMWPAIANLKAKKWYDVVSKGWGVEDTAAAKRQWESGQILAADHILLLTQGMNDAQKADVKKKADALRAKVTAANFAATASKNSQDQQSARQGGSLGIFPKGSMVPEFEKALVALKPGEISPVIQTQYGYHIIHRPTYDQVKSQLLLASKGRSVAVAESTYLAKLEQNGKIEVKKDAPTIVRALGNDPDAYRRDKTVLATSTAGKFTTSRLVGWLETLPPQARVLDQIKQSPDSLLVQLVRNFVKNELVLKQADSAKVQIDPAELAQLHASFTNAVRSAWAQLGVMPASLADSAKSEGDREKLAAKRIDGYFARMVQEQAPFVAVPTPLSNILREKFKYSFNDAGFDRAVQEAAKIRSSADSAHTAQQPPTAVPLNPSIPPSAPPTASSTPPGGKK
ncbi:MAG TPA: peptidylprolyl isomerase [Gemmatimonadaceae bacterium]|jgi:parvulin-like peptidyl-prolyl cis-trans isomerase-like protein|nr:peptidylprolyl isomerase [Gemmatimonadaceae bacterium]